MPAESPRQFFFSSFLGALQAADKPFHDAPASAKAQKNPYEGQAAAVDAGKHVYARNCLACHGKPVRVRATCHLW